LAKQRRRDAPPPPPRDVRLPLVAILFGGLLVRLLLTPSAPFRGDAHTHRIWAQRLVELPLRKFYDATIITSTNDPRFPVNLDHLPGDLWFHWVIAHLYQRFGPGPGFGHDAYDIVLKLVPSLADIGISLVLFLIARLIAGPQAGLAAAAMYAFNPGPILLSAVWGQWDALSLLAALVALWLALRGTPEWSLPVLTYACLIKPQFILLLPLLAILWWRQAVQPHPEQPAATLGQRGMRLGLALVASLAVFLIVSLPFSVGVAPLPTSWTITGRLTYALEAYDSTSLFAANLWLAIRGSAAIRPDDATFLGILSYRTWGTLLLVLAFAVIIGLFWRRTSPTMLVWAALAATFSTFMLPTRVHERYLLPAVALAVLLAAVLPRLAWLALGISATYVTNIGWIYYQTSRPFDPAAPRPPEWVMRVTSLANVALLVAVFVVGVRMARRQTAGEK
jgi:Gpi18-like mannosyltransferase